jgi:hypothetical protein
LLLTLKGRGAKMRKLDDDVVVLFLDGLDKGLDDGESDVV